MVMGRFDVCSILTLWIEVWSIPPLGRLVLFMGRLVLVTVRFELWSIPNLGIEVMSIQPLGNSLWSWLGSKCGPFQILGSFQLYRSRCKIPHFGEARVVHGEFRVVVHSKFGDRGGFHSTFGEVHCGHG